MKTTPVDLLWQTLRDNETKTRQVVFSVHWSDAVWCSTDGTEEELFDLHRTRGAPVEIRISDKLLCPVTYRCHQCGGLVRFDGTPPDATPKKAC